MCLINIETCLQSHSGAICDVEHGIFPMMRDLQASPKVTTSITALSLNNTGLVYGQNESFETQVQVPLGSPVPQGGIISFLNGTEVLATAFLNGTGAVVSGNNVVSTSHAS